MATVLILVVAIPAAAILLVGGGYYLHYAGLIDAQLKGGPFRTSLNIYGAPVVLSDGDALAAAEIEAELRLAGYERSGNGKPGTFQESPQGLDVIPPAGAGGDKINLAPLQGTT